ncbi:DNA replication/repair protein RecF [Faunimonas pinastri]|nr:DNA replication/repair protein RecF [Faunimonas pinastri]
MPDPVALTSLSLTDVRNYSGLSLGFSARLVALIGPNGAGKTNLLEAISLLTPGRGLRRAAFEAITRLDTTGGWAVSAMIERDGEETRIGTGLAGIDPGSGAARRVRINGASAPSAEALLEHLRLLWLTPAMDALFTGPAGDRRRFLDRLVLTVDPGHGRRVNDMDRLLTSRNRLLDEGASPAYLDAVEAQLAEKAVAVAFARAETVALLQARIEAQGAEGSAFPSAGLSITGEFDDAVTASPSAMLEVSYRDELRETRFRDRAAGRTLSGPHRSDLSVTFAAKAMPAALSSTGEQKALLIGIILAHADLVARTSGMTPILLLDEIAAHLDPGRRAALFARLETLGVQAFMTGTDADLFRDLPASSERFEVVDGHVVRLG